MPRKSRAKAVAADSDEDEYVEAADTGTNCDVEEIAQPEQKMVPIPFLTDKPPSEEEIPTYVIEMSKSARAIW